MGYEANTQNWLKDDLEMGVAIRNLFNAHATEIYIYTQ